MNLETATYLAYTGIFFTVLSVIISIYFYKKSKKTTEKIADDVSSMMPKTREQEIRDTDKKISKATNQQLVVSLIKFAKIAMQAENTGAMIRAENGIEVGTIIIEYLKRTDKDVKKALKETDW